MLFFLEKNKVSINDWRHKRRINGNIIVQEPRGTCKSWNEKNEFASKIAFHGQVYAFFDALDRKTFIW